ncbi:MAG: hypothetical protein O9342_06685 [Beijerinckiaceae bacterium]|nr:hypothetical protein [Beijerinckiaceae bacterium]
MTRRTPDAAALFRRFFALLARFQPPPGKAPGNKAPPAPEIKGRITRIDPTARRGKPRA